MCGFFANVSSIDDDIKINLCHHSQQSYAMISVVMTLKGEQVNMQEGMDSVTEVILNAMQQLDGVLIIKQGTVALNSELLENCTQRQKTRRYENMSVSEARKSLLQYVCLRK